MRTPRRSCRRPPRPCRAVRAGDGGAARAADIGSAGREGTAVQMGGALADQVTRGLERAIEVIEAYLVVLLLFTCSNHIVAEGHEGHMDGFDPSEQIWINCSSENESVN